MKILLKLFRFLVAINCLFLPGAASAQLAQHMRFEVFPSSPDVAALGKYGEVPVSLFRGVPGIGIPIIEFVAGDITVPVVLRYDASGIRVNQIATNVGLGWSLDAGGVISATVHGRSDLMYGRTLPSGFETFNPNCETFGQCADNPHYLFAKDYVESTSGPDIDPDLFTYSFLGRSGSFVFDTQMQNIYTIPFEKIDIQRAPGKFTIRDERGNSFEFGAGETTAYTSECTGGPVAPGMRTVNVTNQSFYLTKIISESGVVVEFIYDTVSYDYSEDDGARHYQPHTWNVGSCPVFTQMKCTKDVWVSSKRLREIRSNATANIVKLNYASAPRADLPGAYRLHTIQLQSHTTVLRTFTLVHSNFLAPGAAMSSDPKLRRLKLDTIQTDAGMEWSFRYNETMPARDSYAQDHWGYFNGMMSNSTLIPHDQYYFHAGAIRTPSESHVKAGILEEIKYPTGGSSEFFYEINRSGGDPKGGLRVERIVTHDGLTNSSIFKSYEYAPSAVGSPLLPYLSNYTRTDSQNNVCNYHVVSATPVPQYGFRSAAIGYQWVAEILDEGSGGKTVHHFSQGLNSLSGQNGYPGLPVDYAWTRGHPLRTEVYNAGGDLLEETVHKYHVHHGLNGPNVFQHALNSNEQFVFGLYISVSNPVGDHGGHGIPTPMQFEYGISLIPANWFYRSKTIRNIYEGGTAPVTTTEYFYYESPSHAQLTSRVEAGSNTNNRGTRYVYAHESPGYGAMVAPNMLGQVYSIEMSEIGGDTLINPNHIDYELKSKKWLTYQIFDNRWRPHEHWVWKGGDSDDVPSTSNADKLAEVIAYHPTTGLIKKYTTAAGLTREFFFGNNSSPFGTTPVFGKPGAYVTGERSYGPVLLERKVEYETGRALVKSLTEENNSKIDFEYDNLGRLTSVSNNANQLVASHAYHIAGTQVGISPNYVQTRLYGTTDNNFVETTEFFDGLGRSIQTITRGDAGNEIVTAVQYDALGRVWKQWKPYERSRSGNPNGPQYAGNFETVATSEYSGTFGHNNRPFVETTYEASPLSRVLSVRPGGVSNLNQGVRYEYGVTNYDGAALTFTRVTNEENKRHVRYTDALGRAIATVAGEHAPVDSAWTRFSYDVLDRLEKSTPPNYFSPRLGEAAKLATYLTTYAYDTRGNLLEATSPDAGTVRYRYDNAGRMRFSRDAVQHSSNQVIFTYYDVLSRPVWSGIASGINLAAFNSLDPDTVQSFETTASNRRHAWHYDGPVPLSEFPWNLIEIIRYSGFTQSNLKGRLSARAYRSGGQWQVELYSYDGEGRLVSKRVMTQDEPGRDANYTYNSYDRQGRLRQRTTQAGGSNFRQWYDYDSYGRLEKVFASTGTSKPVDPEVTYTRNPDGRKASEQFRGNSEVPFLYTIRGWLREIGSPRDGSYPHPFSALYTYTAGGNVWTAEYFQKNSPHSEKGYRYTHSYDGLDRLKGATYALWASGSMFFSSSKYGENEIDYDRNGNITKLRRRGNSTSLADDLTYNYQAGRNRLTGVADASGATQGWDWGSLGMGYDINGNIRELYDWSRDLEQYLGYDERNLTTSYYFMNYDTWAWGNTSYRYNADGQRYWKRNTGSTAQYYVLDGAATLAVFSPSGSVDWNIVTPSGEVLGRRTSSNEWRYYAKDHLGSTRAVVTPTGSIVEVRDYYPYGMHMPGRSMVSGGAAKEGFTGHELDTESGLINAGARFYIPGIGRWMGVDPLADKYPGWSPYNYVLNNPLRFVDPDGMRVGMAQCDPCPNFTDDFGGKATAFLFYMNNEVRSYLAGLRARFWNRPQAYSHQQQYQAVPEEEETELEPEWQNPTGLPMRGTDPQGQGHFGARRDGGRREHRGIDIQATPDQPVRAPYDGTAGVSARGYATIMSTNGVFFMTLVYSTSTVTGHVQRGDTIGIATNMAQHYGSGMTNHIHVQVDSNRIRINPTQRFFP